YRRRATILTCDHHFVGVSLLVQYHNKVELELSLEEEERKMAEDDWSKYRKGFRERKAQALTLMRSNGSEQPGRLDDQGDAASRSGSEVVTAAISVHELTALLPRCDLPKFSGDFTEFRAFWDHSNADYKVALNRLRKEFDRPVKLIRHQIRKLVQAPPKDVGLRLQYDYLRGTIDALTALGKDPMKGGLREGELSAAEITIAISRNGLLTPVRIKWDEKTKANEHFFVR
ncbi:putative translation initiation factor IF-2, partial [Trichinella spiralis]|uniref:putative translation initiation factor IF-2 n=1 Tax=Trichinella spiralis TaxID=6334 RepID=UPI0001EFDCF0